MFIRRLPRFEYHTPASIGEALDLVTRFGDNGRFIAGGTDLLVEMKKRETTPEHLISLSGIAELKGIASGDVDGLRIGALVTLAEIERCGVVRELYRPLWDAVNVMASAQIRTLATIGGNLCSALPSADTAPPLIALGASLRLVGPKGERWVPVEGFFLAPKQSVRKPDELLTEIRIPRPEPNSAGCYIKLMRRHAMDLALVGAAVCLRLDADKTTCREARIALGSVAPTPIRVPDAEAVLANRAIEEDPVMQAALIACGHCRSRRESIRASQEYRRSMIEVLTKRAILEAHRRIVE